MPQIYGCLKALVAIANGCRAAEVQCLLFGNFQAGVTNSDLFLVASDDGDGLAEWGHQNCRFLPFDRKMKLELAPLKPDSCITVLLKSELSYLSVPSLLSLLPAACV